MTKSEKTAIAANWVDARENRVRFQNNMVDVFGLTDVHCNALRHFVELVSDEVKAESVAAATGMTLDESFQLCREKESTHA